MQLAAETYVDDVLAGRIPAGRFVKLGCERHRRDLKNGHERGLYFDKRAAVVAISFFGMLRHWKGEWGMGRGQNLILEPAQQFWIWQLFGWKRADGSRRFRKAYLEVARKNGKTTLAAGVALFLAFVEGEPGAEVYSAATRRDQAKICWRDAKEMVKRTPQLNRMIDTFQTNLSEPRSGSKFEPLSSDYNGLDGLNVHGAICDELHAWPQPELWGVLKTGTGARRQPLMLAITTAGVDQQGVCYQQREYVSRILRGKVDDDSYWGMIYTLDMRTDWPDLKADDDWQDADNWRKANPLLGISQKVSTLAEAAREAKNKPAELNQFLRWHMNVWTQATTRWVNPVAWEKCGRTAVDEEALAGRRCFGGLDLSKKHDISAFVLVFPPEEGEEHYQVLCRFWLPEDNMLERVRRDQVPYDVWARLGLLSLTPGNVIDYDFIVAEIMDLWEQYQIVEIAFDRWGAALITQQLQEIGGDDWMVPFGQGWKSMSPAMTELGNFIEGHQLAHGNNLVLNWMADNLVTVEDAAGNIKPDKNKSREKIDGMVALIMGIDRATRGAAWMSDSGGLY